MGKNIRQSVKLMAFNTVHKKDTIFVFGHGPTRTTTDVIFSLCGHSQRRNLVSLER